MSISSITHAIWKCYLVFIELDTMEHPIYPVGNVGIAVRTNGKKLTINYYTFSDFLCLTLSGPILRYPFFLIVYVSHLISCSYSRTGIAAMGTRRSCLG